MNLGIMGGTFDPVHLGHLAVAEEARRWLNLVVVLFIPAGQPRLKSGASISPSEHRVQMLRLALADKPYFKLSTIEIERVGPSYTVDTMAALRDKLGAGNELFFILSWSSLAEFPKWREPSKIIKLCRLVVAPRPGYSAPDLDSLEASVPGISQNLTLMDKPQIDISASVIRDLVARGLPIHHLVPEPVDRYIKQHRLYLIKKEGAS